MIAPPTMQTTALNAAELSNRPDVTGRIIIKFKL